MLTLALGIGVNTAMYSVIHSVLLEPWPLKDPARVLVVLQRMASGNTNLFSTQDFLDWKQQHGLLAKMGAHVSWQFNLGSAESLPERIVGGQVSYHMLPLLGVQPMLGRLFSEQEDISGSGNFVELSYALWKNRYKSDASIVGKAIQLNGAPYTVVGVMPEGFDYFDSKELLWTPLQLRWTTKSVSASLQDGIRLLSPPLPASLSSGLAAFLPSRGRYGLTLFRSDDTVV